MIFPFLQVAPSRFPSEVPVVFASTSGLDVITRSRFQSLGKSLSIPVSWRVAEWGGFKFYELLVPYSGVEAMVSTHLRDEDLDANAHATYWLTNKDRFFSLPRKSLILDLSPGTAPSNARFVGRPLKDWGFLASSFTKARKARKEGYPLRRMSLAARSTTAEASGPRAVDVCALYAQGKSVRILRTQAIGASVWECGSIRDFPLDYASGMQNHGSAEGVISG